MTKLPTWTQFTEEGEAFAAKLAAELDRLGLDHRRLKSDHICFRVGTTEEYLDYKEYLSRHAELLVETPINGRPIASFRLKEAIPSVWGPIPVMELPAPKPGKTYSTEFEHCEFVISETFEKFQQRHPKLNFRVGKNIPLNSELILETDVGLAKFHHLTLERVIEIEQSAIEHIIFDFDGTLIDSHESIHHINSNVFSQILGREVSFAEAKQKFRPEFKKLFEVYEVTDPKLQKKAIELWGETAAQQKMPVPLFDGIREVLNLCRERGLKIHIWTAREAESTEKLLRELEIETFFETVNTSTAFSSKPQAENLVFPWQKQKARSLLMIGDNQTDLRGAQGIGAIAGAALWDPTSPRELLYASGAELHFQSPSELRTWLETQIKLL
jgi:phosphoglycolate phosphatase-like HAD superfamily hydrolase/predicted metalloenzyme YecM